MEYDIVLVSSPAFTQECPSLGLASLASYLKEKRYNFLCYDYGIQFYKNSLKRFKISNPLVEQLKLSLYPLWGASNWLSFDEIISINDGQCLIKSLCPVCSKLYQPIFHEFVSQISSTQKILDSYVEELVNIDTKTYGFSLFLGNAIASLYIISKLKEKKPDTTIIVGGPETSPYYRAALYSKIDDIDFTIYHSEGEIPIKYILSYLKGEISKQSIPGISCKNKNGISKTNPPPRLDLNNIPIPDFELVETGDKLQSLKTLDLLVSKGCNYHCTFCNESLIWGSFHPKNSRRIFEELRHYVKQYGITQFELVDNSFTSSSAFLKALKNLYNAGIKVTWTGNCKINELTKENLSQYQKYGLTHCYFGIESGSPKILHLMGKNIDLTHASRLLQLCHLNQIKSSLYFMVGFPSETSKDFQKTLDFIETNNAYIYDFLVSVFTLMTGTPIVKSNLLTPIPLGSKFLNAFTYQTKDGINHEDRKARFLALQEQRIAFQKSKKLNT
ncbi:MAG: B12-binding domain-containing radical SAM protein [Promethearchaeota archaeon]